MILTVRYYKGDATNRMGSDIARSHNIPVIIISSYDLFIILDEVVRMHFLYGTWT
jgi:hypothetical protein